MRDLQYQLRDYWARVAAGLPVPTAEQALIARVGEGAVRPLVDRPGPRPRPAWAAAGRALFSRRRGETTATPAPSPGAHRWRRPGPAVAAAFLLTIVVCGGGLLLFRHREETPVTVPTTVATSTALSIPTTTAAPTPAGARFAWTRVADTTGALSGPGANYVAQVIAGGPGLVAVGAEDECMGCWGNYSELGLSGFDNGGDWSVHRHGAVWLSSDGEVWTRVPDPDLVFGDNAGVAILTGVADNGSRLVVVGITAAQAGTAGGQLDPRPAVWVSEDDGSSWVRVPNDEEAFGGEGRHLMWSVIATEWGFVAAGDDLWTSPDGWAWTRVGPMDEVRRLVRTEEGYLAVGLTADNTAAAWTSPDGTSWVPVELPPGRFGEEELSALTDAVAGPAGLVAVGQVQGGGRASDGAVWRATAEAGGSWVQADSEVFLKSHHQEIRGVALVDGRLVAIGVQRPVNLRPDPIDARFGPAQSWVSEDGGRTWASVESEALGVRGADISMTAIAVLDGKAVAMGSDGPDLAVWIGRWLEG